MASRRVRAAASPSPTARTATRNRLRATRSSPARLSLRLGTGTTKDVPATLHFASLPPKADILIAVDTTGSMGAAITDARSDADALVYADPGRDPGREVRGRRLQGLPDRRVQQLGGPGDYPWRVDQDFTTNAPDSSCSGDGDSREPDRRARLLGLPAAGGDDMPEAYNRAFYEAYSDTTHLHWDRGASRFMIVLGDSLPHDANLDSRSTRGVLRHSRAADRPGRASP